MGLLDVVQGMQNDPRGPRGPSTTSGGMSKMAIALIALLGYKALKSFTGTQSTPAPGGNPGANPSEATSAQGMRGRRFPPAWMRDPRRGAFDRTAQGGLRPERAPAGHPTPSARFSRPKLNHVWRRLPNQIEPRRQRLEGRALFGVVVVPIRTRRIARRNHGRRRCGPRC
jgi:hypothetical protein